MEQLELENRKKGGLSRRQLMTRGLLGLTAWAVNPVGHAFGAIADDLEKVSRIPPMEGRETPLLVLQDYKSDPDAEIERHLRKQLPRRQDLLKQINKRSGSKHACGWPSKRFRCDCFSSPNPGKHLPTHIFVIAGTSPIRFSG